MSNKGNKTIFLKLKAAILILLMTTVSFSALSAQSSDNASFESVASDEDHMIFRTSFSKPQLKEVSVHGETFTKISMPNTFSIGFEEGSPTFPVYPLQILLPYQKEVKDISVSTGDLTFIDNNRINLQEHPIAPYQKPVHFGGEIGELVFNEHVYQSYQQQPNIIHSDYSVDESRGYAILTLNVYPTKYQPATNQIAYFKEIILDVELKDSQESNALFRNNPNDEAWVKNLVANPEVTNTYEANSLSTPLYSGGLCDPADSYDYVIVCRDSISDFSGTNYTWTDFINRKQAEGLQTTMVTVEEIEECEDYWNDDNLFNDTPALIREFVKDAYEDWGITYLFVAGDVDGPAGIERRLMSSSAEPNIEAEIYWSNLDNTFNADGDNEWGEEGDDGFDLYADVFIGSIPADEGIDISNWMTKAFYYADSTEKDYLDNAAFYGGDTGWSCQGDDFIDFTIYGTDNYMGPDPNSDGPWPSFLGFLQGFDTWNASNPGYEYNTSVMWTAEPPNPGGWQGGSEAAAIDGLKNDISDDKVTILNGIAHANSDMSLDVYASSWEADYHNTKPFFMHDYGCHCGEMSGSDDGVLHSMLFHSDTELAFACIYNTGYGWGNFDSSNSSSALQQKLFWEYCFNLSESGSTNDWQLAKAQQYAKDVLAPSIDWGGSWRENIQCSTLFGDPAQLLKIPFVPEHDLMVTNLEIPSVVAHGETQTVSAQVRNVGNNTETNLLVNFTVNGSLIDSTTITSLDSMESTTVSFTWNPDYGTYLVGIDAAFVTDEYNYNNNHVNKTVEVIPAPVIEVTPNTLNYMVPTNATDTDTITIENLPVAETDLIYNITFSGDNNGDWLSADSMNGTIPIGGSDTLTITVNSSGFDEGSYEGYVVIESNDIDDPEVIVAVDLTVVYGDDMKAVSVNSPVGSVLYGDYMINATVQNIGFYDQTGVTVNCSIYEGGIGGTILDEDFSTNPSDWTITDTSGTAWEWSSSEERMENSWSGGPNAGYLDSPVLDCSGKTGISLSYWHDWKADYSSGDQDGWVRGSVDGGNTFPYLIDEFHHNDPPVEEDVKSYNLSWADNQENVVVRFEVYNDNDWHWYVDDVNVSAEITGPLVYHAEETVDLNAYESTDVDFSPMWNATAGVYGVQVSTLLGSDENPGNDNTAEVVSVEGPDLSFDPTSYDAGMIMVNESDSTSFDVWNSGLGTLSYNFTENCDWLTLSSYSGDSTGENDTITVDIDTAGLDAGSYHCDVSISSNGGTGIFSVDMAVITSETPLEDVNQSVFDRGFPIRAAIDGDWAGAQNFTPTMSSIAKVDLYLRSFGTPEFDLVVELREDGPEGTLLDSVTFSPSEIPSSWEWFSVDFADVAVSSGTDYFIVVPPAPSGVESSFGYEWGYALDDMYDDGAFWFTRDGGSLWRDLPDSYEFTFSTYGLV